MHKIQKFLGKHSLWCMIGCMACLGLWLGTSLGARAAVASQPNLATPLCVVDDEPVLSIEEVDSMAQFPGGEAAMVRFLSQNVKYPDAAQQNGIEGVVMVSFVVTSKGAVTQIKVEKSVDALLDAEALRVIKMLPTFKPAQKNGKAVAVKFMLPVMFRLR